MTKCQIILEMEGIQTCPRSTSQTKNLISPSSVSFPTDHNKLTPYGNASLKAPEKGAPAGSPLVQANGIAPVTPAATPEAQQTGSGLTPTNEIFTLCSLKRQRIVFNGLPPNTAANICD
jgi:hypothetical protein